MYETIDVTAWPTAGAEPMGTKRKIWLCDPGNPREKWLFKYRNKEYTGDDWSEKVASELAAVLGVPHARVELAKRGPERGVICRDLVGASGAVELIPGDRVLAQHHPDYPDLAEDYRNADHTLGRVLSVLERLGVAVPDGTPRVDELRTAVDVFCGYLMFDALIGNTDRNPGNWAVLGYSLAPSLRLCPSYDHASSLGYRETDAVRVRKLGTQDRGDGIAAYAAKAGSALYGSATDRKPLKTHGAFRTVAGSAPSAARFWLVRLGSVPYPDLTDIVARVSPEIMSDEARRFACELLRSNREILLTVPLL